jgi:hypothetical protein
MRGGVMEDGYDVEGQRNLNGTKLLATSAAATVSVACAPVRLFTDGLNDRGRGELLQADATTLGLPVEFDPVIPVCGR